MNPLLGRGFTLNIEPYFLQKLKVKKIKCRLLHFFFGTLGIKVSEGTHVNLFYIIFIHLTLISQRYQKFFFNPVALRKTKNECKRVNSVLKQSG